MIDSYTPNKTNIDPSDPKAELMRPQDYILKTFQNASQCNRRTKAELLGQWGSCEVGTPALHFALCVCVCLCNQGLVPGSLRSPSTTVALFFSGASENRINDQQQGHEKVVSTSHQDFTALGVCHCFFSFL